MDIRNRRVVKAQHLDQIKDTAEHTKCKFKYSSPSIKSEKYITARTMKVGTDRSLEGSYRQNSFLSVKVSLTWVRNFIYQGRCRGSSWLSTKLNSESSWNYYVSITVATWGVYNGDGQNIKRNLSRIPPISKWRIFYFYNPLNFTRAPAVWIKYQRPA